LAVLCTNSITITFQNVLKTTLFIKIRGITIILGPQTIYLSVETYRTNVKYFSIKVAGPLFWNNLNKNIKESRSIHVFKNSLKKYLTEQLLNIN